MQKQVGALTWKGIVSGIEMVSLIVVSIAFVHFGVMIFAFSYLFGCFFYLSVSEHGTNVENPSRPSLPGPLAFGLLVGVLFVAHAIGAGFIVAGIYVLYCNMIHQRKMRKQP